MIPLILLTIILLVNGLDNRVLTPEELGVHHLVIPGNIVEINRGSTKNNSVTVQVHVFLRGSMGSSGTNIKGFLHLGELSG